MPRVSLRRGLFYLVAVTTLSFLFFTVHHPNNAWLHPTGSRGGSDPSNVPLQNPMLMQLLNHGDETAPRNDVGLKISDVVPEESGNKKQDAKKTEGKQETVNYREELLRLPSLGPVVHLPHLPNNFTKPPPEKLLWFFKDGLLNPTVPAADSEPFQTRKMWPDEAEGDRIVDQLMFKPSIPPGGPEEDHPDVIDAETSPLPYKKILMYNGMSSWNVKAGRGIFLKHKCPVDTCVISGSRTEAATADAIMFKDHFNLPQHHRPYNQIWIMYMLECPLHTQQFTHKNVFNWTATYRHDSDIVTPYERYVYYYPQVRQKAQDINYAANKTKQVAWFVSNCGARNNRLNYAKELGKYINVDIFGACGSHRCPRSNAAKCFSMLNSQYKFYLAFENSNCRDYITEKFFVNGLSHNILPIVMGAHPEDYKRAAPERSFIHVDDFESPKHLAQFLHVLDKDDDLYNEYFRWKGTGEFINTYFMCRLCALLHDVGHTQHYEDMNGWWRPPEICINGSWRKSKSSQEDRTKNSRKN